MSSIGRTHHLRCMHSGCKKRRPYWSEHCKQHRAWYEHCQSCQSCKDFKDGKTILEQNMCWIGYDLHEKSLQNLR